MAKLVVTIDGPAGSGKSTMARRLAERIGAGFLDTGAMYRAVTLAAMQAEIDLASEKAMLAVIDETDFDFRIRDNQTRVSINGRDVTEAIRSQSVTANSRYAASAPLVRQRLVTMQRKVADDHERIVTEGRDQGTVAFPGADCKIYLTADVAERARRRALELRQKGETVDVAALQREIEQRDRRDMTRTNGPLKKAEDAVEVDTTGLSIEQVVDRLVELVEQKCC